MMLVSQDSIKSISMPGLACLDFDNEFLSVYQEGETAEIHKQNILNEQAWLIFVLKWL